MMNRISVAGETLRTVARAVATWWLVPIGIPGLLVPAEFTSPGRPPARAGAIPSAAFAESPPIAPLPEPQLRDSRSLEEALRRRRSVRTFTAEPLTLTEVSSLLWAGQGITDATGARSAPSAGALYPIDLFLVAGAVEGLDPGVYRYEPMAHRLTRIAAGDRRATLYSAALYQDCVRSAPMAVAIAGTYERTTRKYGERGVRYVHMEAGCVAENISLAAAALGLGTVVVGAFDDRQVGRALDLPAGADPLCIMPVGRPADDHPESP